MNIEEEILNIGELCAVCALMELANAPRIYDVGLEAYPLKCENDSGLFPNNIESNAIVIEKTIYESIATEANVDD